LKPYFVRSDDTTLEIWSGKRIQHGDEARSDWQRALKSDVREATSRWVMPADPVLAGYYDSTTSPFDTDVENSLFTNLGETMPRNFNTLRFERGTGTPQASPVPIDLVSGHLHYYRYSVGGTWTTWRPAQTIARWTNVPRRISDDTNTGTARPVWFALRQANSDGLVSVENVDVLRPGQPFGLSIVVHKPKNRSHQAITNSEFVVDGVIAAFHNDPLSDQLVSALRPKLPAVTESELRHALSRLTGPLFPTPAARFYADGSLRCLDPDDNRCWLGQYTVCQDSTSKCLEVSGELFTIQHMHSDRQP
jgi:hypothetical protein